jgi:hypothetical protein
MGKWTQKRSHEIWVEGPSSCKSFIIQGPFGSAISISTILKIAFLKIMFLKSLLFKIAQVFGKIG